MKDKELKALVFTCPKCGTDKPTGANGEQRGETDFVERHCHGTLPDGSSCAFRWSSKDDAKYFHAPLPKP